MLAIFFIALVSFILLLIYACLVAASRADDEMVSLEVKQLIKNQNLKSR